MTGRRVRNLSLFTAVACAVMVATTTASAQCDEIVATGHADYVPVSWQRGESLEGASVDLIRLIGNKLGIPVRVVHSGSWKRAQAAVFTGEVDLLLSLYKTSEREALLDYTSAYTSEPVVVVTLTDTDLHYRDRLDLQPYQGGVVIGDSFGEEFDAYAKASLNLHTVPTVEHLLNLLDHKRIQYAIHGLYPVLVTAHKMGMSPRMRTLVPPLTQEAMYMAISKQSGCGGLVHVISSEIEKMRASGLVDTLLNDNWNKWAKHENIGLAPPALPDQD
ncbi:substrate-binding periplasmic protein [Kordiimonas aestuarii]|uniref:substrate-binding periplasmic protein n=1 Tax=Kordiimonas aestuarii TaxID=1005925 RepID=UPI0021CE3A79|nr:transporter substrate-binding domain-containing protein [Kordiimonas aestuarii]